MTLVLGDDIFYRRGFRPILEKSVKEADVYQKAIVVGCFVDDPKRYCVAELDQEGNVLSIEEKPANPKSNYAVVGLLFYPNGVVEIAKSTKSSACRDLEINTFSQDCLGNRLLKRQKLGRGFVRFDTGTN